MKEKILQIVKCGVSSLKKLSPSGSKEQTSAINSALKKMKQKIYYPGLINQPQHHPQKAFLKFGLCSIFTGALATASYATYAYTLDEIKNKLTGLRERATYVPVDDAPILKKLQALLYSAATTVPAKCIELYVDFRRPIQEQVQVLIRPSSDKLLPDMHPREQEQRALTLVLDLDETLIATDWKVGRGRRTFKRPGVDAFLEHLAQFYEIVVYSDLDYERFDAAIRSLDRKGCIRYSLSRHATKYRKGKHYRDLSKLNRDPSRIIYVSGHALESTLQPENSIQIKAWNVEADDRSLLELVPFLEFVGLHRPLDIRTVLACYKDRDVAFEFNQHPEEFKRLITLFASFTIRWVKEEKQGGEAPVAFKQITIQSLVPEIYNQKNYKESQVYKLYRRL